ncbi:MAG: chromosome segregation protein SMC [bacterium]
MYLKKLEIYGFKSFADKVEMEFGPGITVIVGPNGCGKSNLVDAIRWVLGERSSKLMRTGKIRDVIFSGSDSRRSLGMAEVSITLGETSGAIPIDYDEVTITRRVFRNGENEYYINGNPVRLKDVTDLFFDTGIGTDSYFVVEQGKIGQIINARPEARRMLLEEAAGIMRYKHRKHEALIKLDHTETNLVRINDIVSEVRKQMDSLTRQAQKAEHYLELKGKMDELRRGLYIRKYLDLKASSDESNCEREKFWRRLEELQSKSHSLEEEIAGRRENLEERWREIQSLQEELFAIDRETESERSRCALIEERISRTSEEIARTSEEIESLNRKIEEAKGEYKGAKDRLSTMKSEIESQAALTREREALLQIASDELREREDALEGRKLRVIDVMTQITRLRNEIRNLEIQRERIAKSKEAICAERSERERELETLRGRMLEADAQIREESGKQEERRGRLAALQGERDRNQGNWEVVDSKLREVQSEFKSKESRLRLLSDMAQNYEGFYKGVKSILQRRDESPQKYGGIYGAVADLIKVEAQYEMAIEVALGGGIQNIVTETADDAKDAIEWLKRENKGRATFLPLDILNPQSFTSKLLGREGIIGSAVDLVKFDPNFSKAIHHLLGRTLIVDTMDTAIYYSRNGGIDARLVTLAGEVVSPWGEMTGGSTGARGTGLLGRNREIRELREELQALRAELSSLESEAKSIRGRIADLDCTIAETRESIHRGEIQIASAEKDRSQIESDLSRVERHLKVLSVEEMECGREIDDINRKGEEARRKLEEMEETNRTLNEDIAALSEDVQALESERERCSSELTESKVALASLQQQYESLERETERLRGALAEMESEAQVKKEGLLEFATRRDELQRELSERGQRVRELEEEKRKRGEEVRERRAEHDRMTEELHAKESELVREQGALERARGDFHRVELQCAELRTQMDTIAQRLREEYNISPPFEEDESLKDLDVSESEAIIAELEGKIKGLGNVNLAAVEEFKELQERYDFLTSQQRDLVEAKASLSSVIRKIDHSINERFLETYEIVRKNFSAVFKKFFSGGRCDLVIIGPEDEQNAGGIDIIAQPPGKRLQNINSLSGGEKALTATALLFGLFMHKPSPFCILDEVDAPLDDPNIDRFARILREFSDRSQFIVITHNKLTMEIANTIYGITMEEKGVSKMVSVKFRDGRIDEDAMRRFQPSAEGATAL